MVDFMSQSILAAGGWHDNDVHPTESAMRTTHHGATYLNVRHARVARQDMLLHPAVADDDSAEPAQQHVDELLRFVQHDVVAAVDGVEIP